MRITRTATTLLAGSALGISVLVGADGAAAAGNTILVGNPATCTGSQFPTITQAVAVAAPGDTIKVCPGTYGEHVVVDTPDLTFLGGQSGVDARARRAKAADSVVSNAAGGFTLTANAADTTINGFVISGGQGNTPGVADFAGASGLSLVDNVIQVNGNGLYLQNPDGSHPALVSQNAFINNNAGGNPGSNGDTGSGVFVNSGPADNTQIVDNVFRQHSQTAINFAGDSSNPSTGLVVSGNRSIDDATFVVATNSSGAVIEDNNVQTSANAPGGHGTGILDFGANTSLRIVDNTMKATGSTMSSGISVSNYAGSSAYTTVTGNSISGWYNDLKVVSGNRTAYVANNKLISAQNDGIVVQPDVSGVVLTRNIVSGAATFACEDQTTGSGTAGTANTWLNNRGGATASSPQGICTRTSST